jgi:hypothetical protein
MTRFRLEDRNSFCSMTARNWRHGRAPRKSVPLAGGVDFRQGPSPLRRMGGRPSQPVEALMAECDDEVRVRPRAAERARV